MREIKTSNYVTFIEFKLNAWEDIQTSSKEFEVEFILNVEFFKKGNY